MVEEPNMPTYEYFCDACGQRFEQFQSIKADPLADCPKCRAHGRVRRLISGGAGLIFKGSGFYITDYRSDGYKTAAKSDKEPTAAPSSSESSPSGSTTPSTS
jgi:putative FmdB family regulatory protein